MQSCTQSGSLLGDMTYDMTCLISVNLLPRPTVLTILGRKARTVISIRTRMIHLLHVEYTSSVFQFCS